MGNSVFRQIFGNQEVRLLINGLDAAGKTTMVYKLKLGEVITTIPTIGFNVETVQYKNVALTVWDVGGRDKIRPLWRHYYQNTAGIIWVVDTNDRERLTESMEELTRALKEEELRHCPLLVLANKQDLPNAMSVAEVTDKLGLYEIRGREWYIQATCATSGDGLYEGLDWLSTVLSKNSAAAAVPMLSSPVSFFTSLFGGGKKASQPQTQTQTKETDQTQTQKADSGTLPAVSSI